jgi:hypothetical protein
VTWLPSLILATTAVSPVDAATNSLISYILGYGVVGIVALAFAFRFIVPKGAVEAAVQTARADLVAELERLRAEKTKAEEQRDEALKIAQVQIVPLLTTFSATTTALLPLLQELVARRDRSEGARDRGPGPR